MEEAVNNWVKLEPHFEGPPSLRQKFDGIARRWAEILSSSTGEDRGQLIERLRVQALEETSSNGHSDTTGLQLAVSLLSDLADQGWELRADQDGIAARRPEFAADENGTVKEKIRRTLLHERDKQLNEPSVRTFIQEMEARQLTPAGWVSIFSLMRDGKELAQQLQVVADVKEPNERAEALRKVCRPYLQFVSEDDRCQFTGFRLMDIWRYFRMTWSIAHKSTPGRRMMILIRDAAAPFHPVMGIAALTSAVVQLTCRDRWIGWDYPTFLKNLVEAPTKDAAAWLLRSLDDAIRDIYVKDFIAEGVLKKKDLHNPTAKTIEKLSRQAVISIERHRLYPKVADVKAVHSVQELSGVDWQQLARSPLFRGKRAKALARMLQARMVLREAGLTRPSAEELQIALRSGAVKRAVSVILREVKSKNVGVGMMDISVCGAVPPYNAVLGGKLVASLMASPEVVEEYKRRYSGTPSLIASSMRGAAVVRPPRLVLLGTTSLYGTGSSQYNRIKIPGESVGSKAGEGITYVPLGETLGFGSFHFSKDTLSLIESFVARSSQGRRVNSIFGEGVNPRLRKIRQGLDGIGLPADILRHGSPRLVYMVPLAANFRDVLMGRTSRPRYILPTKDSDAGTEGLAEFWRTRWLSGRIEREGILESVAEHVLAYPVRHGARVALPNGEVAATLFDR